MKIWRMFDLAVIFITLVLSSPAFAASNSVAASDETQPALQQSATGEAKPGEPAPAEGEKEPTEAECGKSYLTVRAGFSKYNQPVIALYAGISDAHLKPLKHAPLNCAGMLDLNLGFSEDFTSPCWAKSPEIIGNRMNGFVASGLRTAWADEEKKKTTYDVWRLGIMTQEGYGYPLGSHTRLDLLYGGALLWSVVDWDSIPASATQHDRDQFDLFDDHVRFGTRAESSVGLGLSSALAIDARFERAIIFPRHLFWKWLLSSLIEDVGESAIDFFVRKIMRHSTTAGPIVNFALKTGWGFGYQQLRRSDMNWPFDTAPPLAFDTFKAGVRFTF